VLRAARDAGLAAIEEIADAEAARRGLEPAVVLRYFRERLDFSLGPQHLRSIERYREVLLEEGLLPNARELELSE
jgi:predicted solute-binding protein